MKKLWDAIPYRLQEAIAFTGFIVGASVGAGLAIAFLVAFIMATEAQYDPFVQCQRSGTSALECAKAVTPGVVIEEAG